MYIRITHGRFDPAKYDQVAAVLPDVLAAIRRLPGLQTVQAGLDREAGKTVSVTTFDTLANAQFQRAASLGPAFAALQTLGWQGDTPDIYEVWP